MEKEEIEKCRHSLAHIMAQAIKRLYPDTKFAIGPAIDNGCYYDIETSKPLTPDDFKPIEKLMTQLINSNEEFVCTEISRDEALKMFADQSYKVELINDLPADATITTYTCGDFTDLCRGPHVEKSSKLANWGFKINKLAGAYWRGDEHNKMLTRVYLYAFPTKQELFDYERRMEEALKRDHRKLGQQLDLFFISDYAQGMPFFMPRGVTILNELIAYWREMHQKAGYQEIMTPMAMNRALWETSGHWDHYKKNMYTFKVEGEDFAIKPMNCPGCMLYYKERMHSYKDLPMRIGELGKVHRHEASGTLHGLFRVRCFTQDDAHIIMTTDQIESEVAGVLALVDKMYSTFGLKYHLELSTMPDDHIGDVKDWELAEDKLKKALNHIGKDFVINEGDGAFYGPKIDIHIEDAIGRTWQCGTIQLDMQLPKRFNLEYTDKDGQKKEPIMIHRVIYGSIERFFGIITENFAGAFPTWLAPEQVRVMNIAESSQPYAKQIAEKLENAGIRVTLDDRNEKIGYKIREGASMKLPYMVVLGDQEAQNGTITVRMRGNKELKDITVDEFIARVKDEIKNRTLN